MEAGGAVVAARMVGRDWRWLCFPFLGLYGERSGPALAYLRKRGYRAADTSIVFRDWRYTEPFVHCKAKGDQAAIEAMKHEYFRAVDQKIELTKARSQRMYGRMIPLVSLIHVNG